MVSTGVQHAPNGKVAAAARYVAVVISRDYPVVAVAQLTDGIQASGGVDHDGGGSGQVQLEVINVSGGTDDPGLRGCELLKTWWVLVVDGS